MLVVTMVVLAVSYSTLKHRIKAQLRVPHMHMHGHTRTYTDTQAARTQVARALVLYCCDQAVERVRLGQLHRF